MPSISIVGGTMRKLFATPVVTDELPNAEEINADLGRAILDRMSADRGIDVSNRGGWHSRRDLADWAGGAGQRVLQYAVALADRHTEGPNGPPPTWQLDAWANVSTTGDFNMPHVHGATFWAAVYFVKTGVGRGGELVLHDPRMPALQMHAPGVRFKGNGEEGEVAINPKPGLMVLFPGWLAHSVEPWHGTGERISVAMNLRVRNS